MSQMTNFDSMNNTTMTPISLNRNRSNQSNNRTNRVQQTQGADIMFYVLTSFTLPSLICFIFLFYNFIRLPHLRKKSLNILIISLLLINFIHMLTDLPFRLYYLIRNQVAFSSPAFCLIWTWYDNILTTADLYLMAFISVERYIFIFHHVFHRQYKHLLYRIAILICFSISIIWYTVLTFGCSCRNSFSYSTFQCGPLCYLTNSKIFADIENILFFMVPLFVILIGNLLLISRVLIQKQSMRRIRRLGLWRRNCRMIIQLMFVAALYMIIYVPSCILLIIDSYVRCNQAQSLTTTVRVLYFIHLKYLVIFGCPFMILAGQRELHQMLEKNVLALRHRIWRKQWKSEVVPMTTIPIILPCKTLN